MSQGLGKVSFGYNEKEGTRTLIVQRNVTKRNIYSAPGHHIYIYGTHYAAAKKAMAWRNAVIKIIPVVRVCEAFCQNGADEPDTKLTLNKRAGKIAERVVNISLMPPTIRRTTPTTNRAIVLASDPLKYNPTIPP
jgi:hypothetical protein